MPDIKENIQLELLKMIEEENKAVYYRRLISDTLEEKYHIEAEEKFLQRLERFVKSI